MFRLELHELLYVYGGLCLTVILLAASVHNSRRSTRERAARRPLVKCRLCAFEFRDESDASILQCPNCAAQTERRTLSNL